MKTYAIFSQKHDSEIWVSLKVGTLESMDCVRDLVVNAMDLDSSIEKGYVESYPFFQADWMIVGGRLPFDMDFNQVLEIADWGNFEGKGKICKNLETI